MNKCLWFCDMLLLDFLRIKSILTPYQHRTSLFVFTDNNLLYNVKYPLTF